MSRPANEAPAARPARRCSNSPQTQGAGSSSGNRAIGTSPRTCSHADSRRKYSQAPESCPALRGHRIQKGLLVRGTHRRYPKGPELRRADTHYGVNGISGRTHRLCRKKTSQARTALHGGPGKLSPCARPLQALQHGAERREGPGGEDNAASLSQRLAGSGKAARKHRSHEISPRVPLVPWSPAGHGAVCVHTGPQRTHSALSIRVPPWPTCTTKPCE